MITPRLDMILHHCEGKSFADVGTDHGYIPIKLAQMGAQVIATDIKEGPLLAAKKNAEKYDAQIELRLGGGLSPLAVGEVECIIIAGMGGEMIEKIIDEGKNVAQNCVLILQPMNNQDILRRYLSENNYNIVCEDIAVEGFKVYNLIKAQYGGKTEFCDEFSLHLPEYLYEHRLFGELLKKKKREFSKILDGLLKSSDKDLAKIKKIEGFLQRISALE